MTEKLKNVPIEETANKETFTPLFSESRYQIRHPQWYANFFTGLHEAIESGNHPTDPLQVSTNWNGIINLTHNTGVEPQSPDKQKRIIREVVLKAIFPHYFHQPDIESDVHQRVSTRRDTLANLLVFNHQSHTDGAHRMIDHFIEFEEDVIDYKTFLTIAANTYGSKSVVKNIKTKLTQLFNRQ